MGQGYSAHMEHGFVFMATSLIENWTQNSVAQDIVRADRIHG
jgi:hypothetical protein